MKHLLLKSIFLFMMGYCALQCSSAMAQQQPQTTDDGGTCTDSTGSGQCDGPITPPE